MLVYDAPAQAAVEAAAEEAHRLGARSYDSQHVLLGLLRTADPVTRQVTAGHPGITADAVRALLPAADPAREGNGPGTLPPVPAWPSDVPAGAVRQFVGRLRGR